MISGNSLPVRCRHNTLHESNVITLHIRITLPIVASIDNVDHQKSRVINKITPLFVELDHDDYHDKPLGSTACFLLRQFNTNAMFLQSMTIFC